MEISENPLKYFHKSKMYYKWACYTLLWLLGYTQIITPLKINAIIDATAVVFPFLALFWLVPMGIFNIYKSYSAKEPYNKYRAFYLFGHAFFMFLLIAFIAMSIRDVNKMLSHKPKKGAHRAYSISKTYSCLI